MDFITSRQQATRTRSLDAPSASSARATVWDLPEPRPPRMDLYRRLSVMSGSRFSGIWRSITRPGPDPSAIASALAIHGLDGLVDSTTRRGSRLGHRGADLLAGLAGRVHRPCFRSTKAMWSSTACFGPGTFTMPDGVRTSLTNWG